MTLPPFIQDIIDQRRQFVAPTIYRAGNTPGNYNYYSTLEKAVLRYKQLTGQASGALAPDGNITIVGTGPQTVGINADFYLPFMGQFYPVSYKAMKSAYPSTNYYIARIMLANGSGPVYIVPSTASFGIAATVVYQDPGKTAAMDEFFRELQLLKYRYNNLAAFLSELSKRDLSPAEQSIFNQGMIRLQAMSNQMQQIRGTEFYFSSNGRVGFVQLLLLAVIALTAAAAAWTITQIVQEKEKTRRINEAFDTAQWLTAKKTEVAAMAAAGTISEADKRRIFDNIDGSLAAANTVAKNSSEASKGMFGNIADTIKWAAIGLIGYTAIKSFAK